MAVIRYIEKPIIKDLAKKMVFIGGPRQVGKTTMSRALAARTWQRVEYFNWDIVEDQQIILNHAWLKETELVIFDELHKYDKWKNWIKGVFDSRPNNQQYMVTGSARLDVYKKGGDSLMGRYHYWRLHPFTLDEIPKGISPAAAYQRLLTVGGFPEPFLSGDEREARRWRRERLDKIVKEDIRDLDNVRDIQRLRLFITLLQQRVGNLVILNNIARDLEISPNTAKSWLTLVEHMYIAFAIYPYTKNVKRSIIKPPKVFFYDNADASDKPGIRLENLLATMLLKRLNYIEDYEGYKTGLYYIRDKDGREVDFAIEIDNQLIALIEVKTNGKLPTTALKYYTDYLKPKIAIQISARCKRKQQHSDILIMNPIDFAQAITDLIK